MSNMPASPFLSSAVVERPAETSAVASYSPQVPDAASDSTEYVDIDQIDCSLDETNHIHEIFHYARHLCEQPRFVLDEQAFMDALDEPPLFLRQAVRA